MSEARERPGVVGLRSAVPWIVLGLALVIATEPAWKIPVMGFSPSLDELLKVRCYGGP